jgi:protocadherin-16/23
VSGDPTGVFRIAACRGQLRVARAVLDYDLGPRVFNLTVRVTDDGVPSLTATAFIVVSVTDVNNPPVCAGRPPAFQVRELAPAGTTVATLHSGYVSDKDGDLLSFTFLYGNDEALFSLTPSSPTANGTLQVGPVPAALPLDFERRTSYLLVVQAADSQGGTCQLELAVTVLNDNEPPVLAPGQTLLLSENAPVGTSLGVVGAADPDGDALVFALAAPSTAFDITPIGLLRSTRVFDFETGSAFSVQVRATDIGGAASTATVNVRVLDVNDAPVLTFPTAPGTFTLEENAANGTAVAARLTARDEEEDALALQGFAPRLRFSMSCLPPYNGTWAVDGVTGVISLALSAAFVGPLNFEVQSFYPCNASVTDVGVPAYTTTLPINITVVDANDVPVFVGCTGANATAPCRSFSLPESASAGTPLNAATPLTAYDEDGDGLGFSIQSATPAAHPFSVGNGATGAAVPLLLMVFFGAAARIAAGCGS